MRPAALKEWNCNIEALKRGLIDMIVRKGGILDPGNAFPLDYMEFLLFPTFLHQKQEALRPELRDQFASLCGSPEPDGSVVITAFARVVRVHAVTDLSQSDQFSARHLYSRETIESRFHYKKPGLHFIETAVEQITPVRIDNAALFDGCISWIPPGSF